MNETNRAGSAVRVGLAVLISLGTAAGQVVPGGDHAAFDAAAERALDDRDDAALAKLIAGAPQRAVRFLMVQLHAITAAKDSPARERAHRRALGLERGLIATRHASGVRGLADRVRAFDGDAIRTLGRARRGTIDSVRAKRRGDLEAAIDAAQRAANAYDELGRPFLATDAKRQLADALRTVGRCRQALRVLDSAIECADALGVPSLLAQLHGEAMLAAEAAGDAARSDSHAECAERILCGQTDPIRRARFDEARGTILTRRGAYDEAARRIRSAIDAFARHAGASSPEAAQARMHLGVAVAHRGDFSTAIREIERALAIFAAAGMRGARAAARLNLGSLYLVVGRRAEAIRALEQAAEEMVAGGNAAGADLAWSNLANLHSRAGDPAAALDCLRRGRGLLDAENPRLRLRWLLLAAGGNIALGQYDRAEILLDRAQQVARAVREPRAQANLLAALTDFHRGTGDHEAALDAITRAEAILVRVGDRAQLPSVIGQHGVTLLDAHRPLEALDAFDRASRLREAARRGVVRFGDAARIDHARSIRARTTLAAAEAASLAGPEHAARAFTILERHTGAAMRDLLAEASIDARPTGDPASLRERDTLIRAITNGPAHPRDELGALEARLSKLEVALRASDPRYDALLYPHGLDADAVRARLTPGEVLIAPLMTGESAFVFVVDRNAVRLVALGSAAALRRPLDMLVNASRDGSLDAAWKAAAARLSTLLLRPLETHLEHARFLTIVPYGPFCFVPYDLLETREGDLLVDRWPVRFAQSATVLATLGDLQRRSAANRAIPHGTLLALGGPRPTDHAKLGGLPGAVTEVHAIAKTLAESNPDVSRGIVLRTGRAAREATLTRAEGRIGYRAIHLACHGRADAEHPLRCGLWLAPDDGLESDGFLSVREILQLRLDTDVVVLSACDSAVGRVEELEGVQSLTRAFLHAGTGSVVVSNWRVDDGATPALMTAFYRAWLRDGASPMEALRRAKTELRDAGAHPTQWAGFVLWGLGR